MESISTEWRMDMENTSGLMEAPTKEISSMESGTGMEYGTIKRRLKYTQAATEWIRKKALAFTNGLANKRTRASFVKISAKDSAGYMKSLQNYPQIQHKRAD